VLTLACFLVYVLARRSARETAQEEVAEAVADLRTSLDALAQKAAGKARALPPLGAAPPKGRPLDGLLVAFRTGRARERAYPVAERNGR
jgi:hypothetical protein